MTKLKKPVVRGTSATLGGNYGIDGGRTIVVTLMPGSQGEDMIEFRPIGTRRKEVARVVDLYSYLFKCRITRQLLERTRKVAERRRLRRLSRKAAR